MQLYGWTGSKGGFFFKIMLKSWAFFEVEINARKGQPFGFQTVMFGDIHRSTQWIELKLHFSRVQLAAVSI